MAKELLYTRPHGLILNHGNTRLSSMESKALQIKTNRPGRPKSEEKRESISHSAAQLFLTEGYERASMDSIAQQAGVSKQTVYSHFRNKDELFQSCIASKIQQYQLALDSSQHETLVDGLTALCDGFLRLLSDPKVVSMWRLVINESAAHPHVATLFYGSGPGATLASLTRFLEAHADELATTDFERAARSFLAMAAGHYQTQVMLNIIDGVPAAERKTHVSRTTRDFLKLYGRE